MTDGTTEGMADRAAALGRPWFPDVAAAPAAGTRRITIAGDWAPIRRFEALLVEQPEGVYGDLLPLFRESALNVVNVEAVLGAAGAPIVKVGPHLRGDARATGALRAAPFHVACLANNHAADFGPAGLAHTMAALDAAGVRTVGAGPTAAAAAVPAVVPFGAGSVAIVNCAEGEEGCPRDGGAGVNGLDVALVCDQVRELRREGHIVLVVFHGGREYVPLPPTYVVEALRRFAAAGAHAVAAHHPHAPQGIERHHGVPIAYSLGNFVFWQETESLFRRTGYLLHLDFADDRVLAAVSITPYVVGGTGLRRPPPEVLSLLLGELERTSALLPDEAAVRAVWQASADGLGVEGIARVFERCAEGLRREPARGGALAWGYLFTPAHRELFLEGLRRATTGESGSAPPWARAIVERWATAPLLY